MTIEQLIAAKRGEIAAHLATRSANVQELATLRAKDDLDEADETRVTELRAANAKIDTDVSGIEVKVAEYEAERAADSAADARSNVTVPAATSPDAHRAPVVVTSEQRTYAPEKERTFDAKAGDFRRDSLGRVQAGGEFMRDIASAFLGDYEAQGRLQRHMQEERAERGDQLVRAAGTGAFAGLTVPQYLTDLYAPAAAAMRPFADICQKIPLPPEGMTVNISRITTATSAAAQTENAAVSETNIDDTLLTENVLTVAGQQTLSRQSVERSTGAESVTANDLFRRYHSALDNKLINDATTGLTNVAQSVAYTDATPTAAELWPKVLNAQANLEGVYLDQQVNREFAIMHSRRWAWMQSQVGTSWPFISQPGIPTQAGGANAATAYGDGVRGTLPNGMPVIVDNNISTALGAGTEDEIYIVNADECFLWEDPSAPVYIRAEQPAAASLGVLLVVYGYFAYTMRRYTNGQQKIAGTGLIAPTF